MSDLPFTGSLPLKKSSSDPGVLIIVVVVVVSGILANKLHFICPFAVVPALGFTENCSFLCPFPVDH